ncbi:YceI family protein [Rubrolithibacter danxiaensis]|uniref:YceI family protein n=1 Tax=Rubrolithibacter danxiaensis TaxID=3390805 RepID=UPI003BF8AC5B
MKISAILILLISITSLSAFKTISADDKYAVDTRRSVVEWKATKVVGGHHGKLKLASGYLLVSGMELKGGSFTTDMNTITIEEMSGQSKQNLMNHLKSDDFFGVADNPTSTFQITKVVPVDADRVTITGNLTIKGITNPVSFAATIKYQNNNIIATAKGIKVDRTKYNIKYRSKSFFGDIGDKAIDDEFELSVSLVARK